MSNGYQLVIKSDALPYILAQLPQLATEAVMKTAYEVETDAKRRAPVKTGRLRSSIHTTQTGRTSATVQTAVGYAVYVERGTRRMPARPYLQPAAQAAFPAFVDAFKRLEQMVK